MFNHFQRDHDIKGFARAGQVFGLGGAEINVQPGLFGVKCGNIDIALGGINRRDTGSEPGQWFGNQSAAASDIKNFQALERPYGGLVEAETGCHLIADKGHADRGKLMQGFELAVRVPPFIGNGCKAGNFFCVDSAA